MTYGLIPFHGKGFVRKDLQEHFKRKFGGVLFLTDDVEFIKRTQLTEEWIKKHDPVVLMVDVNESEVFQRRSTDGRDVIIPHEFLYYGIIEVMRIEYGNYYFNATNK